MTAARRIFIVEDQRLIAADLENTLRKLGYAVVGSAASGEEAIERTAAQRPELILMDIRLKGQMDGIETAAEIRRRFDVPVVYLTAYADEETIVRAKATAAFGYLVKPFNERELRAAIEIALYKHETDLVLADERARRQADEEFKLLVQGVKDYAIFIVDNAGRVSTWNEGAKRIVGFSAEEVIGRHISMFYPPEDVQAGKPAAELAAALRDGRREDEGWRFRKDGSRFWANIVITPIRDEQGNLRGFGKLTRDLTEGRRQQEALAASEDLFRSFFDLSAVGMAIVDPESRRFLRVNAKMQQITGYREPDLLALTPDDLTLPDDREIDRAGYAAMLSGATPHHACEKRYVRRDGRSIWVLLNAAAVRDEAGKPIRVVSVIQEITATKMTEDQLRDAVRSRDEFLQIASHELKTPMTPLQMQLDMLTRAVEKGGVQNEQLVAKLGMATRQTERLNRLVETLLDVSRITGGRLVLEREELDLVDVVADVADRFRGEARGVGSELVIHADGPLVGSWDRLRVEQVVSNLLSNALKYGAGHPVEVEARASDGTVRLAVTDHGIGIAADALDRIFGRFERAVSMRHYGGLGLGLFIARQICEAHGGTIVARSEPGQGSTFTAILPRAPARSAAAGETSPREVS